VPNVFAQDPVALTPNGDGYNDYWKLKHQSIRECKITIVDRRGITVYRKKIEDMYAWDGWNGRILNSNRIAPEGQYYYVVEAIGYDNVEYKDPNLLEQWRINREGGGTTQPDNGDDEEGVSNNLYTGWIYLFRGTGDF
jgi:gliding motility-associated-like protein